MSVRAFLVLGSALLLSALLPGVASGWPPHVKRLQAISGPSPFAAGCPGALFDDTNITGHELETAITVNPANPRNIIATWKQDVGPVPPAVISSRPPRMAVRRGLARRFRT